MKNTGRIKIIVGVSVAYNFQTGNNKIRLLMEYESVTNHSFKISMLRVQRYQIKLFELQEKYMWDSQHKKNY
jgi:hypothetical protein